MALPPNWYHSPSHRRTSRCNSFTQCRQVSVSPSCGQVVDREQLGKMRNWREQFSMLSLAVGAGMVACSGG
jgi:hypothetical protein